MNNGLGATRELFKRNEAEWTRTLIALGVMVAVGIGGAVMGIHRTVTGSTSALIPIILSLLFAGAAGYVLYLMRPTLRTIEICERGLRIDDTRCPLELRWGQIAVIEEAGSGKSTQVLIQKPDETGYVVDATRLERFDVFLGLLRESATANGIEHRTV